MWEPFISFDDFSFLKKGDIVRITFSPRSQKYFKDDDYDFFFPTYEGKVFSSNPKNIDELLLQDKDGNIFSCINRAGSSAFMSAMYKPSEILLCTQSN